MKKPRYKVVTVTGWPIPGGGPGSSPTPGVAASVLDTAIIHREVARYRSEDRAGWHNFSRLGREGAIEAALAYADKLNAGCEPASAS